MPPPTASYPVGLIAKLLLLSPRRIQQMAAEGLLPRAERGRYELVPVVQAYLRFLRDRTLVIDGLSEARTRLLLARTRKAETEAERLDSSLLRRDQVTAAWALIVGAIHSRALSMVARTGPSIYGAPTVGEKTAILSTAVHELLVELSELEVVSADANCFK